MTFKYTWVMNSSVHFDRIETGYYLLLKGRGCHFFVSREAGEQM